MLDPAKPYACPKCNCGHKCLIQNCTYCGHNRNNAFHGEKFENDNFCYPCKLKKKKLIEKRRDDRYEAEKIARIREIDRINNQKYEYACSKCTFICDNMASPCPICGHKVEMRLTDGE